MLEQRTLGFLRVSSKLLELNTAHSELGNASPKSTFILVSQSQ